jgi:hypothetical protein
VSLPALFFAFASACAPRPAPASPPSTPAAAATNATAPPADAPRATDGAPHAEPARADIFEPGPTQLDGALPGPGIATLRGVGAHEAWVSFWLPEGAPPYDAVVNLETGCVTETLPTRPAGPAAFLPSVGERDGDAGLPSPEKRLGSYLAFLARFEHLVVDARNHATHSDGMVAFTRDHTKVAIVSSAGVLLSRDGGRGWTRPQGIPVGSVSEIHFSPSGRHLVFDAQWTNDDGGPSAVLGFVDTTADAPPTTVTIPARSVALGSTDDGRELYSKDDRCIYAARPEAPALTKVACVPGPRIDSNHFFAATLSPDGRVGLVIDGDFQATRGNVFSVDDGRTLRILPGALDLHNGAAGPGLEGRYAWGRPRGGLRVSTPDGAFDLASDDDALGFDLQGRLVTFHRPPLVAPHKPGHMMPKVAGTLADVKCTLVRAVDPKTGTKVR